jgi:anti-sigma factor RsiW
MPGLDCDRLVELVTDFVEGALDPATERQVVDHLAECDGCSTYLEQMRMAIELSGKLEPGEVEPRAEAALLDAFREWKAR